MPEWHPNSPAQPFPHGQEVLSRFILVQLLYKDFNWHRGQACFPWNNASLERKGLWTAMTNHLSLLEIKGFSARGTSALKPGQSQANCVAAHTMWASHNIYCIFLKEGPFPIRTFLPRRLFWQLLLYSLFFILLSILWSKTRVQSCETIPHWKKVF